MPVLKILADKDYDSLGIPFGSMKMIQTALLELPKKKKKEKRPKEKEPKEKEPKEKESKEKERKHRTKSP